jgi:WD40 repeat protein
LPKTKDKNPPPKTKGPEVDSRLPPPPKIRLTAPLDGGGKIDSKVDKPIPFIPLTPEEDPFIRARTFAPDGPIPPLAKLPPPSARPLLTLDPGGHSSFVGRVFVTPSGEQVITVGDDKAVRVWDLQTGETVHTIRLPAGVTDEGSLLAGALSPNGKRLVVAGVPLKSVKPGSVPLFVLNAETGALVKTISAARADVTCLDFAPDGNQIAVGCIDGSVQLFNINTGGSAGLVAQAHPRGVREVRYGPSAEAKTLATLGNDGAVRIWNLGNASRNYTLNVSTLTPSSIDWTKSGAMLGVGGKSGEIALFSVDTGQVLRKLPRHTHNGAVVEINRIEFAPGDDEIIVGGVANAQGWAGVVSAENGAVKTKFLGHTNNIIAVNVSADGKRAVTSGGNQHETYVWSTADGKVVSRLCGAGAGVWGVGWAKDGKSVAWGTSNKRDSDGHTELEHTFRFDELGLGGPPDQAKYQQALTGDKSFGVKRISQTELAMGLTTGQVARVALPFNEKIYSATILPDQKMAVVCGVASLVVVDPTNGKVLRNLYGHAGNILACAPSPDGKYFVTGSSDQTVRVWSPNSEDPVLSIFVAGSEWIAWTPQGYYACSANGERLIAWQINTTAHRFPQVHPAARFRSTMYQPALIKYLIPAGSLPRAMAMAKKFDKALVQTTSVADIVPPEVTVDSPEPDVIIDKGTYTVKASARSAKQPVTSMRLLVNGRPYQGPGAVKKFDKPDVTAEATWEVALTPGFHTFAAVAETGVSKSISKGVTLRRTGEPPKPDLYVLAVGISAYPAPMKLNFAASDAVLLGKTFQEKSKGAFANIEVKLLTDGEATKRNIQQGLDWLKSKMTAKDVGIVSFSGHGTRDLFGTFSLVPVDIDPKDVGRSCLSGDEFKNRLDAMPGRLVAILDACHSGSVAEAGGPPRADNLVRDLTSDDSGVVVMCSSLGRETSLESSLTKAGYFTLGIVEGMSGHGDVDEDGIVYLHELSLYAGARVRQLSEGRQTPTLGRPPGVRPFPLANVGK